MKSFPAFHFPTFELATAPHLDTLRNELAQHPCRFDVARTPEDWLDVMLDENPKGLINLHRRYADYLNSDLCSDTPDGLFWRDWVWLVAHRLYAADWQ